jgi:hypothetical protein
LIAGIDPNKGSPVIFRVINDNKTKIQFLNIPFNLLEYAKRLKEHEMQHGDAKA